ncbi:S-phase kinase-associated protein 2-like isoform X2 [Anticarsia gemmatalis]|uniref:S-phase kinase-associated protein 2-like isoform X2 n=1 Tax=Anticarsia gemmatalis TaxID=129554 RepID=UPI003F768FFB
MSANKTEDDHPSSRNLDDTESPRKKMRMDNSGRKSWSLMDRKTDHEMHKTLKRKRDIENVNPNINLVTSPLSKLSPKSPRMKASSPNPGPSRLKSPKSADKHPLQPTDQQLLETSLIFTDYLIDEETPLAQSVSAQYLPVNTAHSGTVNKNRDFTPLGLEEELIISRRQPAAVPGADSFNILSDEMILSVFRWLPKRTLAHCMCVCKRWHRVACDETLWQRLDLGNKTLAKDAVGRILARKPVIIRLASSEIAEWHPTTPPAPSRIQYLDLSMCTVDTTTLNNLLSTCSLLNKLSVESVLLADSTCQIIGKCSKLETLNLTMAQGITAQGLTYILSGCPSIQSLNISWCNLDEASLEVLVAMLPQRLQRLNISGARIITDSILERLTARCPRLVELDISDCGRLTARSATALASLHRLEHLATSRCYLLPAHALYKLGSTAALQYLDVWGMLHTHALSALRGALPHVHLNQFMFSAIARPTVGPRRTSIWGLRTRD